MTDGYLSKDRQRINRRQRERRADCRRLDYYASPEALAMIEAKRAQSRPGSVQATNSAVLDAIVTEWATLTGINNQAKSNAMTAAGDAGVLSPFRARAYDFGDRLPTRAAAWLTESKAKQCARRVPCGARRHRDSQPCRAMSEPGKRRCRWHGGRSTGPQTAEGKARALANLRQYRQAPDAGEHEPTEAGNREGGAHKSVATPLRCVRRKQRR